MKKTVMYIDPPSGWRYGFPKPAPLNIREMTTEQLHQWFAANGYPQKELDYWANSKSGMAYGMFEAEEEEENTHPMSNTNTNTNAMKLSDIDLAHRFRLFLAVPFENKDEAKAMGALWSAEDKRWFFDVTNINQMRWDELMKRQWLFSFHGVLKSDPTHKTTGVYFFTEDFGGAAAPAAPAAAPFKPTVWTLVKDGNDATMSTTADGRIVLVCDEFGLNATHTKDEARAIWNGLIADGWTVVS